MISIDGTTEDTYKKTRTGNFKTIKRNMDFLATYKNAKGFRISVNFIVQQNNFKEMGDMVDLCCSWKVDKLSFVPIRYWESGSYTKEEMKQQRVFEPPHPLFAEFLTPRVCDNSTLAFSYLFKFHQMPCIWI